MRLKLRASLARDARKAQLAMPQRRQSDAAVRAGGEPGVRPIRLTTKGAIGGNHAQTGFRHTQSVAVSALSQETDVRTASSAPGLRPPIPSLQREISYSKLTSAARCCRPAQAGGRKCLFNWV